MSPLDFSTPNVSLFLGSADIQRRAAIKSEQKLLALSSLSCQLRSLEGVCRVHSSKRILDKNLNFSLLRLATMMMSMDEGGNLHLFRYLKVFTTEIPFYEAVKSLMHY